MRRVVISTALSVFLAIVVFVVSTSIFIFPVLSAHELKIASHEQKISELTVKLANAQAEVQRVEARAAAAPAPAPAATANK